eukprot:CAMPEP_0172641430 /NCGR_PEP_ID=MMETSP1068-20121228/227342_1 /TAXON_ID=35684 /ORGANISM="Pseudopedinella elastica, Strain CCMP716" /LENGTH=70 /DNA_ID=CAMNT_0013455009 /DNA_START=127 /DNA_END=339 /DNA_ORIENTATION=-
MLGSSGDSHTSPVATAESRYAADRAAPSSAPLASAAALLGWARGGCVSEDESPVETAEKMRPFGCVAAEP